MQAQVHLDIKPGNFCIDYHSGNHARDKVYIIDFGGAWRIRHAEEPCNDFAFFGTADFSGSTAMLQQMPGPSDDIESLCYRSVHLISRTTSSSCSHDDSPSGCLI